MRSWLGAFTTRGTSFLAAGVAATLAGLLLSERDLVSIGVLLMALPLFSALAASRARYRLSCTRDITPRRVAAGQTAQVRLRLQNVSRLPTGLLLAEDTVPYALGTRPRYVLNGIERTGSRDLSYPVRSDLRGKFSVGPLEIRVADAFGLVELGHSFSSRTTFVVTPKVVSLPRAALSASWLGDGEGRARTAAAAGEDDVVPRAYRDGDELRRVHWRSTARYGELMVRREEQQWRNRALVLIDTRRSAHAGSGATSSFEFAVSAAASIGTHLAREGLDGQLITDTGPVTAPGSFEEVLLNSLAVMTQSRHRELDPGLTAMRGASGLLVAVVGRLSAAQARQLAACRRDAGPAIALLLSVSTWATGSTAANPAAANTGAATPGAATPGAASPGALHSGAAHSSAAHSGAAHSSAAHSSAAHSGAAQGGANSGPANGGSANSAASYTHGAISDAAAMRVQAGGAGNSAANTGAVNTGAANTGAKNTGATNTGAANNGAAKSGAASGPAANGGASNGAPAGGGTAGGGTDSSRAANGRADGARPTVSPETSQAAMILRAAGWRVAIVDASTPLAAAWQRLSVSPVEPGAGRWVPDLPPEARTDGSGAGDTRSGTQPGGAPGEAAPWASREAGQEL